MKHISTQSRRWKEPRIGGDKRVERLKEMAPPMKGEARASPGSELTRESKRVHLRLHSTTQGQSPPYFLTSDAYHQSHSHLLCFTLLSHFPFFHIYCFFLLWDGEFVRVFVWFCMYLGACDLCLGGFPFNTPALLFRSFLLFQLAASYTHQGPNNGN